MTRRRPGCPAGHGGGHGGGHCAGDLAGYRVVGEPALVREVLARPDDFAPANALTAVQPLRPAALRVLNRVGFALPPVLASASGESHARTRRLVAGFLTPARVAAIGPRISALAEQAASAVDAALADGPVDLASEISQPVPPAIMAELIGVEIGDVGLLKRWSRHSLELFWGRPDEARQLELAASAAEFYSWLRSQSLARRGRDCLFGAADAAGLSVRQVCSLGYFLLIAGHETTSQLINIGLYRALQDARQWQALACEDTARGFVRRLLATESSVPSWRRVAARATVLAGEAIPAGAEIVLRLTGQHPPQPDRSAHALAFGHGPHRCLGAGLAELEAAILLRTTARLLPDITAVGPEPDWLRLLSFQTPRSVIVARARQ